jgi:hypothetical protein
MREGWKLRIWGEALLSGVAGAGFAAYAVVITMRDTTVTRTWYWLFVIPSISLGFVIGALSGLSFARKRAQMKSELEAAEKRIAEYRRS